MFKLRMMIVWVLVVLGASGGVYWLVCDTTHMVARTALDERLDHHIEQVRLGLAVRARSALESVDAVARMNDLALALTPAPADAAAMQRAHSAVWSLLEGVNLQVAADLLWVTGADGRIIARQGERNAFGDGVRGFPAVASALEGRLSDHLQVVDGRVMIVVSAPLVDPRGPRVAGAVVAGYELGGDWLKALAMRSGLSWSLLVNRQLSRSTLDASWNDALVGAFARLNPAPGAVVADLVEQADSARVARFFRFGGGLAEFESGLVASAPLPLFWLTLEDRRVQFIGLGTALALLLGLVLAWWLSAGLRRRAQHLATTILEMRRTGTLVATMDPKLSNVEHRPFVDLLNTILADQNGRKDRPTLTGRADILSTLDSMVAIDEDSAPRGATGGASRTQASAVVPPEALRRDSTPTPTATPGPAPKTAQTEAAPVSRRAGDNGKQVRAGNGPARRETPAQPPIPEDDGEYFEQIYREFLSLRETLGQPTNTVSREKFVQNLETNKARIRQKSQCERVRFTVFEKDGKASVKAAPAEN